MSNVNYAICFDFPESGEPFFAWLPEHGSPGWTCNLSEAKKFDTKTQAESFLKNAYGKSAAWGVIVEVGQ